MMYPAIIIFVVGLSAIICSILWANYREEQENSKYTSRHSQKKPKGRECKSCGCSGAQKQNSSNRKKL